MSSREAVFASIRKGLPRGEDDQRRAAVKARLENPKANLIPARGDGDIDHRIATFTRYLEAVGGSVEIINDINDIPVSVTRLLRANNLPAQIRRGKDDLLAKLPWHRAGMLEISEGPARESDTASLSHGFAGIAESGTVILVSGADNPTTLNFLPDMHVVVLEAKNLHGSYEEAWARLRQTYGAGKMPRTVNMISGPSRTADIEQTIVRPAHGPKNMHAIIVR